MNRNLIRWAARYLWVGHQHLYAQHQAIVGAGGMHLDFGWFVVLCKIPGDAQDHAEKHSSTCILIEIQVDNRREKLKDKKCAGFD